MNCIKNPLAEHFVRALKTCCLDRADFARQKRTLLLMQTKHLAKVKIALQKKPPGPISDPGGRSTQVYKPNFAPALSLNSSASWTVRPPGPPAYHSRLPTFCRSDKKWRATR